MQSVYTEPAELISLPLPAKIAELPPCQIYNANAQQCAEPLLSSEALCQALEAGGIIYFPVSPVCPDPADHQFLLTQRQLESSLHKNVAYRPMEDRLTGAHSKNTDTARLHAIMKNYSRQVGEFLNELLMPYQGWRWDYASYRPIEEQDRPLRLHARNDLIHVDSFPTRPTYGGRILRFFTNLNPESVRVWQTSGTMREVVPEFGSRIKWREMPQARNDNPPRKTLLQSHCSPYDAYMTRLHNLMKEDTLFQMACAKSRWEFQPGSAWMVMTDMLGHSVLSGQYALEQTVIVPLEKTVMPHLAPINILKEFYGAHYE